MFPGHRKLVTSAGKSGVNQKSMIQIKYIFSLRAIPKGSSLWPSKGLPCGVRVSKV